MKVIDSNRYYLPGTGTRWLHIASVSDGLREYMCFADTSTRKIYIEEITGGVGPRFIDDESQAQAIADFLTDKGHLDMGRPLLPDKEWYNRGKPK